MEKEPIIVRPSEKPKSAELYYLDELESDMEAFPEEIRQIVRKVIDREHIVTEEQRKFDIANSKWWQEKYGFPFTKKDARNEVLNRKYNPEKVEGARRLQRELMEAIKVSDEEKITELKNKYQEQFADQMEAIEVIFGVRDFIKKSKELSEDTDKTKFSREEYKDRVRDLTEFQFLFTHFLVQNNKDREFLELFWRVAEAIAGRVGAVRELNILRRGQMAQVAVYRIMEELGDSPKLSHPNEDAFNAIDLWETSEKPIQIKGWNEEVPAVFTTDEVVFPAVQIDVKNKRRLYNSAEYFKSQNMVFRTKVKKYGHKIGKDLEGYMLAVPYSKIDFVNGEPAQELVEFFKGELKTKVQA